MAQALTLIKLEIKISAMKWLLFLLVSCSVFKTKPTPVDRTQLPEWAYAPQTGCDESVEICVSGEGVSAKDADHHALSSLAAVFETKVQNQFTHTQTYQQLSSSFGQVKESQQQFLRTEVNQYLQAVTFKERYIQKKLHYVWASLNKVKVGDQILKSMKEIDENLKRIWSQKSRTAFRSLLRLLIQRLALEGRLSLLDVAPPAAPVSFEQIQTWYQRLPEKRLMLEGEVPLWLKDKMKALLTETKIVIVSEAGEKIQLQWNQKEEFLKVNGFSKWTNIFTLKYINVAVGNKGTLTINQTATGRSRDDAELKLKQSLVDELEQSFYQLNIE